MNPLRFIRPDFAQLEEYTPVKPLEVLAREIGMPVEQLVKLDANENLYGPHPAVRAAVAQADLHIYPDPGQTLLRAALGDYLGVSPEQIVAGAGADDLIDVLIRLVEPEAVVTTPPSFGMYRFLAKIAGSRVVPVPRLDAFELDHDGIESAVAAGARMIFLTTPNNPTGNLHSLAEIRKLCALDAVVVVDEAYIEFAQSESAISLLGSAPNLVVLRTFSKWAALAGLRVGYAVCHEEIARRMMAIKQPYNVNVAGDVAARAALAHRGEIFEQVRCIAAERQRLFRALSATGWLEPVPSHANFVLCRVRGRSALDVRDRLRERGVLVRHYASADLEGYIRVSAGRPEDTDRLLASLAGIAADA